MKFLSAYTICVLLCVLSISCTKRPLKPDLKTNIVPMQPHMHSDGVPIELTDKARNSGSQLYAEHCQLCHGLLPDNKIQSKTAAAIQGAIAGVADMQLAELKKLNQTQVEAIAYALQNPGNGEAFSCASEQEPQVAPDTIKALSKTQYVNTLADLFSPYGSFDSIRIDIDSIPVPSNKVNPFDTVNVSLNGNSFRAYHAIAQKLSEQLFENPSFVMDVFGSQDCLATEDLSASCLNQFAERMGRRIYRRPVPVQELSNLLVGVAAEGSAKDDAKALLRSMLIAVDFVFHMTAYGQPTANNPSLVQLSPYEFANRLSYALWESMPDSELFQKAADGSLTNPVVLNQQVNRLLAHPKARQANANFYTQWLQLKVNANFSVPTPLLDGLVLDDALKTEITRENSDFVNSLTFDQNGSYTDLLTAPDTFPQSDLYKAILGSPSAEQRPGVLWRVVLSGSTFNKERNLIHSGIIIRERLLCESLPTPAGNITEEIKKLSEQNFEGLSMRDEVTRKTNSPACASCHTKINPLAFAGANHYDWIGRFISEERRMGNDGQITRFPVDAMVNDPAIDAVGETSLQGPQALAMAMAGSKKGVMCIVQKRYASIVGRAAQPDPDRDGCALKRSYDAVKDGAEGGLLNMVKALIGPEMQYKKLIP